MRRTLSLLLSVLLLLTLCACHKDEEDPITSDAPSATPAEETDAPRPGLDPIDGTSDIDTSLRPVYGTPKTNFQSQVPDDFEEYAADVFKDLGFEDEDVHRGDRYSYVDLDLGSNATAKYELDQEPNNPQQVQFYYASSDNFASADWAKIAECINDYFGSDFSGDYVKSAVENGQAYSYIGGTKAVTFLYRDSVLKVWIYI